MAKWLLLVVQLGLLAIVAVMLVLNNNFLRTARQSAVDAIAEYEKARAVYVEAKAFRESAERTLAQAHAICGAFGAEVQIEGNAIQIRLREPRPERPN